MPISTSLVSIEGNATVYIDGFDAAVCSTLTLGDRTNLATLNITSSNADPLSVYSASTTALTVEANSNLVINTGNSIKFDPDGTNTYNASRTNFKSGSTVEYQSGAGSTVQVDNYGNLVINDASGSTGTGDITVGGSLTKEGTANTFSPANTINVAGLYTHTEGDATYSSLIANGSHKTVELLVVQSQ